MAVGMNILGGYTDATWPGAYGNSRQSKQRERKARKKIAINRGEKSILPERVTENLDSGGCLLEVVRWWNDIGAMRIPDTPHGCKYTVLGRAEVVGILAAQGRRSGLFLFR